MSIADTSVPKPSGPNTSGLTGKDAELLPSQADIQWYAEHGWYLTKKLLTDEEVDMLGAASERFYAGHRDRTLPVRPPNLAYWEPSDGPVQRHNDYICYENKEIAHILSKPVIGAVAAALAGASADPRVPVHAHLQAAQRGRSDQPGALAHGPALLADLHVGPDADRVHPLPRLR